MTNDPPNERVLAMYEAWARQYELTLATFDADASKGVTPQDACHHSRADTALFQARIGLCVTRALIATWHRDNDERLEQRTRWEQEIAMRYKPLQR
ncbi:MAG: hypothetical protein EOO77_31715 [Oxalobacteraceae bacterium]|nr:MAG: hypothetical protein EOO77_31715 [Oxalobacteraceae bacterium]